MAKRFLGGNVGNHTRGWLLFAFVLLLIGNIFSFISSQKVSDQSQSVNHTNRIIDGLENILSFTVRSESSLRGFLISGDEYNYDIYRKSNRQADSTIKDVKELTEGSPWQLKNMASISDLVTEIHDSLNRSFQVFRDNHKTLSDNIKLKTIEISEQVTRLQDRIYKMQMEEKQLWQERSQNITEYIRIIKLLSVITTFIAVLLTFYSILVYNKENRAKEKADLEAGTLKGQLEKRVNELAKMNDELKDLRGMEKFAATGRIARTIAHEVRNPLTNINLAVEQLKTEFEGSEEADTFLEMVSRNSMRINKLVSDLLSATRPTETRKSSVSVNTLLDDCLKDAADRIRLSHVNIVKEYDPRICSVAVDVDKVRIAFLNIIVNGIEAMKDGGTLKISTCEEEHKCTIRISDTGTGMSQDQLNRVFEPFFTTKKMGNGLGLANTHNIILSHNGSIKCDSEQNVGTTFTIQLDFS